MNRSRKLFVSYLLAIPVICMSMATVSRGYVDLAPTLGKIIKQSPSITLVEVVDFNRTTHTVTLRVVRSIKGAPPAESIQQVLLPSQGAATPRPIAQWASPGARGVLFSAANSSLLCFGTGWYQTRLVDGAWRLDDRERPDLPLAYYGTVSRLSDAIDAIVAGKSAVITAVAHNTDNEAGSFDLALNRQNLPGVARLQRIHASANMPDSVAQVSNPAYFIGIGAVDEADLPEIVQRLKSPDSMVRAEAAADLRTLGRKARSAAPELTTLLKDPAPRVRLEAAAALLVINPKDQGPADVLAQGLASADVNVRRIAASSAGFSGAAGAPLAEKLASLLKDADPQVRMNALQSISILGPAAEKAVPAVIPLLDDPDLAIDAADALGRIGATAQPALPRLTKMLSSDQSTVRWAAVRAMAQIGGPDAHPAVDFMVQAMPTATEVEGYNMMIYLALLGPVARDAAPAIQSFQIKNPVLPSATMWALNPDRSYPWNTGFGGRGGRGGRGGGGGFANGDGFGPGGGQAGAGGPGGGGPGGGFGADGGFGGPGGPAGRGFGGPGGGPGGLGGPMMQAYVHELGPRLRSLSQKLAQQIMDGSAGEIPVWGYQILSAGADLSLDVLTPHLADSNLAMRERATVALGYMGEAAAPAREKVQAVLRTTSNDREKRLLEWCLREMDGE
jgi:HEAT repeat protein